MGLVITPLETPRRFNPLAQPLETSQKLGGRELVWRFDGGDITSDGGALVLKQLEERTEIVRRFAACFQDYRKADRIEHPLLDLIRQRVFALALMQRILSRVQRQAKLRSVGKERGHPALDFVGVSRFTRPQALCFE